MGNTFIFDSKQQYDALEGGIAATAVVFLVVPLLMFGYMVDCIQEECLVRDTCEFIHDGVAPFFTSLTIRGFKTNMDDYARHYKRVPVDVIKVPSKDKEESDLHHHYHPNEPRKIRLVQNRKLSPGTARNQTYAYFLLMAIITCFWFICIMVDNTFYYKTTSCDDIDPRDMSHVCFVVNESYRIANCSEDDQPVICYLFSPSFLGLGLAFSIAKFLTVCADAYYVFIAKVTRCLPYHAGIFRLLIAILATAGFIAWWIGFGIAESYTIHQDYFGFGRVPMRVSQSVLLLLTALIMTLCLPWSYSIDDESLYHSFRELVYKDDNEELLCTCCLGDRVNPPSFVEVMELREKAQTAAKEATEQQSKRETDV